MTRLHIYVNGILNFPGSARGWTDAAVTETIKADLPAEKFEYLALPLTRRLFLRKWSRALCGLLKEHDGRPIVLVGHSNGCELICRALKLCDVKIERLHLISGACRADFDDNGLNDALRTGQVGEIVVYVAGRDWPMRIARWSQNLLGWLGLGYGSLGLSGGTKIDEAVRSRVSHVVEPTFGHSTWFSGRAFRNLMLDVLKR